jgi:hypothetical protein
MFVVVSHKFVVARHPFRKRVSGAYKARVFATGTIFRFSQRTCPIHYFRSKTHVWGGFAQFRCRTSPILKTVVGVDEDIHTTDASIPIQVPISGPITRARARQLKYQVITLLSS